MNNEVNALKEENRFNAFGGWLVFLFVSLSLSLLVYMGWEIYFIFLDTNLILKLILLTDYAISIYLILRMLKILRKRDVLIPDQMVQLITWFFLFSIALGLIEAGFLYLLVGINESKDFISEVGKNGFRSLIFYAIWTGYFKKSKRALTYYGKNAK